MSDPTIVICIRKQQKTTRQAPLETILQLVRGWLCCMLFYYREYTLDDYTNTSIQFKISTENT